MKLLSLRPALALLLAALTACSDDGGRGGSAPAAPAHSVTLVTSTGGTGDNGYNDLVLAGAMRFYRDNADVTFSLQRPRDEAEARAILDRWAAATAGQPGESLIILASDTYRSLISAGMSLNDNQRILLFECGGEAAFPSNVSTFRICRYGASYLSGATAAESPEAHIVAATDSEGLMRDALTGFSDGYRDASGRDAEVHFLSDGEAGFSMPNKAYELAAGWDEVFVFPLAGGSNSGLYKYTREDEFTLQLLAGMDVDCSDYSTRVPFSLLVHIDGVVYRMLDTWLRDGALPRHTDYTLADRDAIEVKANPLFLDRVNVFLDYYSEPDYWQKRIADSYEAARQKEVKYYE